MCILSYILHHVMYYSLNHWIISFPVWEPHVGTISHGIILFPVWELSDLSDLFILESYVELGKSVFIYLFFFFRLVFFFFFFYKWTCNWYNSVFVQYVYTFNIPQTLFIWLKEGEGKCSKESKNCPKNDEEEEEEEEEEEYRKYEGNNKSKRLTFKRKSKKGFQMCSFSHKLFEKCFIVANVSLLWDYRYAKHVASFQLLVFIYSSSKYTCQMLDFASCSEVKYCICYWIFILRYST